MNHESLVKKLLPAVTALAILGMGLRWGLYAFCMDAKKLLPVNHPVELLLWLVTAAAMGLIAFTAWKLEGSNKYKDNFEPSAKAVAGHILAGTGMLVTALLNQPLLSNNLGMVWKVLGLLSGPSMLIAAWFRFQGKRPWFLLHIVPCLFLVLHIINHYQLWSGNPQLQDYIFTIFSNMSLMFFCFYTAAFEVGSGKRQIHLFMGLSAIYLGIVSLPQTEHALLTLGGVAWAFTDLCTLNPKPRVKKKRETEAPNEAA